jgi:hypothetical protein
MPESSENESTQAAQASELSEQTLTTISEQLAKRREANGSPSEIREKIAKVDSLAFNGPVPCIDLTKRGNRVNILLGVFLVGWCLSLMCIGSAIIYSIMGQVVASSWKPVPATIETNEYVRGSGGRRGGGGYVDMTFRYEVDGKSYVSKRFDNAGIDWTSTRILEQRLTRYPAGARVTAFVNPSNPSRAVLDNSINPETFGAILFMLPFLLIAVFMALWLKRRRSAQAAVIPGAETPTKELGDVFSITVPQMRTSLWLIAVAIAWCLLMTFAGVFRSLVGVPETTLSQVVMYGALVPVLLAAYVYRRIKVNAGKCDVKIDSRSKEITIPSRSPSRAPGPVPLTSVVAIVVDGAGLSGGDSSDSPVVEVSLITQQGAFTIVRWGEPQRARNLGVFLAEKLSAAQGTSKARR